MLEEISHGTGSRAGRSISIKGGKHFFLVQAAIDQVAFNPYSSAFAGLLTGLFTERAYGLLSNVVDGLAERINKAVTT
jgi:hypothetical protein